MPVGILKDTLRLSYSYLPTRDQPSDETVYVHDSFEDGAKAFPNVYSVPYPSSIHWSPLQNAIPPWAHQSKEDRKTLMLFIGSDNHGDVQVRRLVHQMCNSYQDNSICRYERFRLDATLLKGTAQFCLEPGGDSPWRKSISDSIAMGCIPVTFSEATSGVAPWHWRSWRSLGQVPVPRQAFLRGEIDLKTLLQRIPADFLVQMQSAVAENGGKWQYSLDDNFENDAFKVTAKGLATVAENACSATSTP